MQPERRTISFPVAEQDVLDAQRSHYRANLLARRSLYGYLFVFLLVYLIGLVSFFWTIWSGSESGDDFLQQAREAVVTSIFGQLLLNLLGYSAALLVALPLLTWIVLPQRVKRIYAQQKSLHLRYEVAWDLLAMDVTTAQGALHYPWADFMRWTESKTTILVYQSDMMFNFIPKSAFKNDDLDDFRSKLIMAKVPKASFL